MRKDRHPAYHLALVGVMAALVYVVTMFRFPLLGSKVHFANAMCLLAGLLLGGGYGGAAAGLGSALYDLLAGGSMTRCSAAMILRTASSRSCRNLPWRGCAQWWRAHGGRAKAGWYGTMQPASWVRLPILHCTCLKAMCTSHLWNRCLRIPWARYSWGN